jgi:hypothetical protein
MKKGYENEASKLIQGAIDLHVHASPDGFKPRALDFMEAATQAKAAGYAAVAIKNHEYCTAPLGLYAQSTISGIHVCGGLVLNYAVGGINPYAVEAAHRQGGEIIWLPTFSAKNDSSDGGMKKGLCLITENGDLVDGLKEILEIIRDHRMILATGHVGYREISKVIDVANKIGLYKILINHPFRPEGPALNLDQQKSLVARGAILEHCAFHFVRKKNPLPLETLVTAIKAIGTNHCSLSSDLGQVDNPLPVGGLRLLIDCFLREGMKTKEIETMVSDNPRRLIES